jgi:negative regulator of genetic competence, sporulation and motility
MAVISYPNAQSTLSLNGYTFQHLASGEALNLAPANERTSRTNSMNNGVSVSNKINGGVHDLTVIVQKHSPDHKILNDARNSDFPIIFEGSMKRSYNEGGKSKKATTSLTGGSITTQAGNVDNNEESDDTKTYVIQFRDAKELF